MNARALGFAIPLVLGVACTTSGSHSRAGGSTQSDQIVFGEIGEVSAHSLSIRSSQGDTKNLELVPETSIIVDGRDASYDELKEGQPVRASFNRVDGRDVAVEIQVGAAPRDASGLGTSGSTLPSPDSGSSGSAGSSSPDAGTPPPATSVPDTSAPSDVQR